MADQRYPGQASQELPLPKRVSRSRVVTGDLLKECLRARRSNTWGDNNYVAAGFAKFT